MNNNRKQSLSLVLSVVVHGAIVALLMFSSKFELPKKQKQTEVELMDPQQLMEAIKQAQLQQKKVDMPLDGQIVEQDEKAINDETPEKTRFMSRHNQKVVREEQAQLHGKFKNTDSTGGEKTVERKAGKTKEHAANAKESDKDQADDQKADKLADRQVMTDDNGVPSGPYKKPSLKDLTPSFKPRAVGDTTTVAKGGGEGPSATDDHLKNVKSGLQTMLSTREFVYYSYYNRIKDKLRQYWEPKIKEKVERIVRQGRTIASADRVTRIVITLDKTGTLVKVQVIGASGVSDLDEAAVEAFRAAAPFPNPPKGIVEADGTIKIRWDFILEANASGPLSGLKVAARGF